MFYTDHGTDFTSVHLEQVGANLKMQLVFSQVGRPRGRGKIERFFQSVEQLLLEQLPGYAPSEAWPRGGASESAKPRVGVLTLEELERCFRTWLLEDYHRRVQKGQSKGPQERWEEGGFLPRMSESLEQLDLLLVQVARKRRVQQSGIAFEGYAYIDPTLAAYVGEEVQIRYDPQDLGEIRVFFEDRFVCRAICPELSGQTVSLKEIVEREALVKRYVKESMGAGRVTTPEPESGREQGQEEAAGQVSASQGGAEGRYPGAQVSEEVSP